MKALSKPQLEALARLHGSSHDFRQVLDWLKESLDEANRQLHTVKDVHDMKAAQGEARTLADIVERTEGARTALTKRELAKPLKAPVPT